jgi:hypothetical protein
MAYSFTQDFARLQKVMDRATSIFNQRPWELRLVADDRVELYSDPDEHLGKLLPREVVISCGAALYNLRLAIHVAGREPSVWLFPDLDHHSSLLTTVASAPTLLASIEVWSGRPSPPSDAQQELYEALWLRRTERGPYRYVPVPPTILVEMETAAAQEHAWLRTLPPRQRRQAFHALAAANKKIDEERVLTERLSSLNRAQDDHYGPAPADKRAGKAPPTRPAIWLEGLEEELAPFENSRRTQLMALSTDDDRPLDWLRAGEALQHALLNGTRYSMSAAGGRSTPYRQQLYYAPLDVHRILGRRRTAPSGYAVEASFLTQSLELANLRDLDPARLAALGLTDLKDSQQGKDRWRWPWRSYFTEIPQVLMRVGYAPVRAVTDSDDARIEPIKEGLSRTRAWLLLLEHVDRPGDDKRRQDDRAARFQHHEQLGPRFYRRNIGRADRGGRPEGQREVVDEPRDPVGGYVIRVLHLREDERRVPVGVVGPGRGSTAVEVPVPEPEGDHVRRPDHAAGGEQPARMSGEELVVGQDLRDEPACGEQVRHGQERDDDPGDDPQPGFLPVDAARVSGDQHGQQPEQYDREHPGRLDPVASRQGHMQGGGDNDRQGHRPPVLAPFGW